MDIRVRAGARPPEIGDVLGWGGDGWEPVNLTARSHRETHVHTDRIVRVAMGPTQSHNFVSGSTGWRIKEDGSAEFNDVTVRGTIYASAGSIGGWTIQSAYLAKDTGTDATSAGLAPTDYPFYAGATYANRASAPFRVTPAGALVATSATISGSITATSGTIGGWTIGSTYISSDDGNVILGKSGVISVGGVGYVTSDPFVSGSQGWRITPTEAEFENVVARGEIRTAVFKYNEVHAQAGKLLVSPNAAKLDEDLTIAASGSLDVGETGRFAANDVVRLKDGTNDVWLTVTADGGDGTYSYTRSSGAAAGTVFRAGTGVVGYGASGEGGVLLDAVDTNGPFIDVFTHAGSPWSTTTTKVRVGNLAGISDADLSPSGYGLYCDNVFLKGKLVWDKGRLDGDGITLDIDETADEAWVKFGSVNDYLRGISGGGIAVHSLEDWIDVRAWKGGSNARCTLAPQSSAGSAVLSYNNTEAGDPDTTGGAKLLYQDYLTELSVVGAGYRAVRMYAQNGSSVYEWFELQPTDSEVFVKLGDAAGAHKFRVKDSGGVVQFELDSDGEVSCNGDVLAKADGFGLMDRAADYNYTVGDHFISGSIPSGYAWAGAPFDGTPPNLDYDYNGSYLLAYPNSPGANERFFLYDAVTTYANKRFVARIACAHNSRVGIRFDDGSDNNYREVYLDPSATTGGLYDLVRKYRDGGGAATTGTLFSNLPFNGRFFVFRLSAVGSAGNWQAYAYFVSECGVSATIAVVGGAGTAWNITRVGLITHEGTAGWGWAFCDWIYSDFS